MNKTWIVAADTSRARIFVSDKPVSDLQEIQTLSHPEARLHEGDLISDTTEGEPDEYKQAEADRFAAHVCATLEAGRKSGEFNKLYLVAAPNFLGKLRKHQSSAIKQLLAGEVDKNLAAHSPEDIRKQLPEYL
ncbi:MAG: host attachment protein [Pseudomonadota bacterium]